MSDIKIMHDHMGRRAVIARLIGISNAAGSGAGNAVSTVVTLNQKSSDGTTPLWPSDVSAYNVFVTPSQACFATVSKMTANSFTVVLTPATSGTTLSAGSFDCLVVA
jgi:hypothetical protein